MYSDGETCLFVRSQREQQFQDLKHTLQVMGRLGHSSSLSPPMGRLGHSSSLSPPMGRLGHSSSLSPPGLTLHSSCPQDFVVIYLLENDRLLSPAVNQLKLEHQIDLCAIAQAFLTLFDGEEDEVETYWLFSKFARKWESQQQHISFLVSICMIFLCKVEKHAISHSLYMHIAISHSLYIVCLLLKLFLSLVFSVFAVS